MMNLKITITQFNKFDSWQYNCYSMYIIQYLWKQIEQVSHFNSQAILNCV
jgi:hypothetical protein